MVQRAALVLAAIGWLTLPAHALDIVVTNDDGVEASTIHALYRTLSAHGHHVIISSETQDNSGKGGAADFFKPMGPLTLSPADPEYEVAAIVLKIVTALESQHEKPNAPQLPAGIGLNVNIPEFKPGAAERLPIQWSREGTATSAIPIFVDDLAQDSNAQALGLKGLPALPGVSVQVPNAKLSNAGNLAGAGERAVIDSNPASEQNVIASGRVAISVIQGNHEARPDEALKVERALKALSVGGDRRANAAGPFPSRAPW